MEYIRATYHIQCAPEDARTQAEAIALEQTVEVPDGLARSRLESRALIGAVESLKPIGPDRFAAAIAYDAGLAHNQLSQLLNLLYGNISILKNVRLCGVDLPATIAAQYPGPRYGVPGLRKRTGVYGRPLLATALKPKGLSPEEFAVIARDFALGGGDIVKDDHNLVDDNLDLFRRRVDLVNAAVVQANEAIGRNTIYFPFVSAPAERAEEYFRSLVNIGVQGVMIAPYLLGLDVARAYAKRDPLVFMAHPTFSGVYYRDAGHGIAPELAVGTFMRWIGMDMSIFPNYAGRFSLSREECQALAAALRDDHTDLRPAWPSPAGGMQFDRIASMAEVYGADAIFLVGGALLTHGETVEDGAKAFLNSIRDLFAERLDEPRPIVQSSCEMPLRGGDRLREFLPFDATLFSWQDRTPTAYKASEELPFAGVTRRELIGKFGEDTAFELRYFELAPGGYTSLEKHQHTHTVIGVRGRGIVLRESGSVELGANDIAYVAPMQVHQLRNDGTEPFGFYCIVDRDRDLPQAP